MQCERPDSFPVASAWFSRCCESPPFKQKACRAAATHGSQAPYPACPLKSLHFFGIKPTFLTSFKIAAAASLAPKLLKEGCNCLIHCKLSFTEGLTHPSPPDRKPVGTVSNNSLTPRSLALAMMDAVETC